MTAYHKIMDNRQTSEMNEENERKSDRYRRVWPVFGGNHQCAARSLLLNLPKLLEMKK